MSFLSFFFPNNDIDERTKEAEHRRALAEIKADKDGDKSNIELQLKHALILTILTPLASLLITSTDNGIISAISENRVRPATTLRAKALILDKNGTHIREEASAASTSLCNLSEGQELFVFNQAQRTKNGLWYRGYCIGEKHKKGFIPANRFTWIDDNAFEKKPEILNQ